MVFGLWFMVLRFMVEGNRRLKSGPETPSNQKPPLTFLRDISARGVFESKADLARKIMRYIRPYNKAAVPFRWSYQNTAKRIR